MASLLCRPSRRFECALLVAGLAITAVALLPLAPQGPLDARTLERLPGAELRFPWWGTLLEPAAAVGHALSGAPSPKVAALSTLAWILAAGTLWGWLHRTRPGPRALAGAPATGLLAALAFLAYLGLYFLVPFPSWLLTTDDPDVLIADLQTHTHASHDGIYPAERSLPLLRERGVEVAAVTEHKDPAGAFAARRLSRKTGDLPAVIPGIELRALKGYVLALGLQPGEHPLPDRIRSEPELADFVRRVHNDHGGAVLALGWRLDREEVARMAASGLDGFEIANLGHPDVPLEVGRAIRRQARDGGLSLVASSDWHGWTGTWRTWTLIRPGDPAADPAAAVVAALRSPDPGQVVPAVAGYLGPPSAPRAVLAPFAEAFRYAAELSPARVLGWWLWIGLGWGIARALRRGGLQPGPVLGRTALAAVAIGLLATAAPLALAPAAEAADPAFHREIGRYGLLLGGLALVAAAWPAVRGRLGDGLLFGATRLSAERDRAAEPRSYRGPIRPGSGSGNGGLRARVAADLASWGRTLVSPRALAAGFPRRLPRLGHGGWLATVAVAVTAGISMAAVDRPLVLWLDRNYDPPALVRDLSDLGKSHWYLLGALAFYLLWPGPIGRARASLVFWGVAASGILVNLVKVVLARYRPDLLLEKGLYGFDFLRVQADYLSFPSGHATTAFSLAMCLALFWPRGRWAFFAAAAGIAATRILLTSHYPSDVLVGAWLGVVTVLWLQANKERTIHP